MKFLKKMGLIAVLAAACAGCQSSSNEKKVGIIVPIEHKAMNEIVSGFTQTLSKDYPNPIKFKVANAQGDINLQRAIIQQMKDEHYDLIVPIGMSPTQMAVAMIRQQPIVSLASIYSQQDREQHKPCHIAVVHDGIPMRLLLQFIHQVYPKLTQLVLIHSPSDKIYLEAMTAPAIGKESGINIKTLMVSTLNELYSLSNRIPDNAQAILVLKDNLIVSGISTLAMAAAKHQLPLISSDQGSVENGAGFALGVFERDVGVEGAKLAAAVLSGKPACNLPIVETPHLSVFINKSMLAKEHQSLNPIEAAAKANHYAVEFVGLKHE